MDTICALEVEEYISKKLYNFNAGKELAWAWNSNENIIMFGPGGYGKSDAAILFNELLHKKGMVEFALPFVMAFGQGMTEEKLLGGIDMKKFQSTGEIIYLLKNAFINHEIVIFEELWDAFPAVLLILKDILQSRCVRMGNQIIPIKTKLVIACTNRSREEVVEDASTEALMQRFLFEKEVAWSSHTPGDYRKALYAATNDGNVFDPRTAEQVANICAASNNKNYIVSPRTCGKAYKSALINGIDSLRGMHGLSKGLEKFDELQREIDHQKAIIKFFEEKVELINSLKKQMELKQSFRHCAPLFKEIYRAYESLSDYAVTDDLVERKDECMKNCVRLFIIITQYMDSFIKKPKDESIPQRFMMYMNGKRWSRAANLVR